MVWFTDGTTDGKGRSETGDFHQLQEVRAYWEAMRRAGRLPRRDDINPRGMASALEQVFLVEQIAPNHGRLRLAGMGLSDLLGMDVRRMPITALLEPVARARLSEALGGLFRGEHILDLWLEAERGIGRPPLMARMLVLPLIGSQGEPDLALGCLCTKGTVGRTPRRFTISRMLREPIVGQSQAIWRAKICTAPLPNRPGPFIPQRAGRICGLWCRADEKGRPRKDRPIFQHAKTDHSAARRLSARWDDSSSATRNASSKAWLAFSRGSQAV